MHYKNIKARSITSAIMAASISTLATGAHGQNLLSNPSFELGGFINRGDGFQILSVGSTVITGWTVISDTLAWGTSPNSAQGVSEVIPLDGSFFLDLQGDYKFNPPYGGVTQTITTVVGRLYHFSFHLGTQQNASSPDTHGPISVVASAGATSFSFTFAPGGTGTQWGEFGFDFTASGTSTAISIVGNSTAGGAYIGLDQTSVISVQGVAATIHTIPTGVEIAWPTTQGRTYRVQASVSLDAASWTDFGVPVVGDGTVMSVVDSTSDRPKRFYRVLSLP